MSLFKRKVEVPKMSVTMSHDGVSIENAPEELAVGLVQFWVQEFGTPEEPAKRPAGFNANHMTEIEPDTMRLGEAEDIEDEEGADD